MRDEGHLGRENVLLFLFALAFSSRARGKLYSRGRMGLFAEPELEN